MYPKKSIIFVLAFMLPASAALAGPDCSNLEHKIAMSQIVKNFEDTGGSIKLAKVTSDNCYEIYGTINGDKVEIYYDPSTGEEISRN